MKKVITVIGGGAAGFFGAMAAAQANPHAEVSIIEKSPRLLVKVRMSGGGRCNVTHRCFDAKKLCEHYPRGHREMLGPFNRFGPRDMINWLKDANVDLKAEPDGRMFPTTDDSQTIIDCFLRCAGLLNIKIHQQTAVEGIKKLDDGTFELLLAEVEGKDNPPIKSDRVLLATGGGQHNKGFDFAKALGHSIVFPVPSLFTFNINDYRIEGLAGISFPKVNISITDTKLKTTGPLLITHWGLSGPGVLKLSAWGARDLYAKEYQVEVKINFLPAFTLDSIITELKEHKSKSKLKQISKNTLFDLPKRFWGRIVETSDIHHELKWNQVSTKQIQSLSRELVDGSYLVTKKSTFKDEFVTAGGISLKEVNFKTMESKIVPGLFFAGEVLNIDGVTGGFNFQSAWTTSYIAGNSM